MMVALNEHFVNQSPNKEQPEAKKRKVHCKWGRWTTIVDTPTTTTLMVQTDHDVNPSVDEMDPPTTLPVQIDHHINPNVDEMDPTTTLPVQTDHDVNPSVDEMDPALWGELYCYVNLEEMIVANLPLHAFYRALSVCKKWNALGWNRPFLEQWSKTSLPNPYFILQGDHGCHQAMLVRDDARSRTTSTTQWELQQLPYFAFQQPLTSVAHGLVFTGTAENCIRGTIFNIHTKVFRRLPPLQSNSCAYSAILAVTDKKTGSYKVMVSWDSGQLSTQLPSTIGATHVYDSSTGTWTQISNNPAPAKLAAHVGEDYAYCDGVMYIKREKRNLPVTLQALFAYNFEHDIWTVLSRAPHGDARVKGLGEWNGVLCDLTLDAEGVLRVWEFRWTGPQVEIVRKCKRKHMVGQFRRRRSDDEWQYVQRNMNMAAMNWALFEVRRVWVIQQTGQEWVEVDRMPASILEWFLEPYGLQGFVNPPMIKQCIKTSYYEQYILFSHHGFAENSGFVRLVLYDMALRSWENLNVAKDWICSCPFSQQIHYPARPHDFD